MPDRLRPIAEHIARLKKPRFTGPGTVPWTKKKWTADHAAYFTPIIEIDKKLPDETWVTVRVKEDMKHWVDTTLGRFKVVFAPNTTRGQVITFNGLLAMARGFPPHTRDRFWLVTTKPGRIRGNSKSGDDGHAKIYLEIAGGCTILKKGKPHSCVQFTKRNRHHQSKRRTVRKKYLKT